MTYQQEITRLLQHARGMDDRAMARALAKEELDQLYHSLARAVDWLDRLMKLLPRSRELSLLRQSLIDCEESILRFYLRYFEHHQVIGDEAAWQQPHCIFVLAHEEYRVLIRRVQAALPIIRAHEDALIVLCGGGFDRRRTEAQQMEHVLTKHGVPSSRLILEEDSVDTIGNAIFAKLHLRALGFLSRIPNRGGLVVITSRFHAVRALDTFRQVFGTRYAVCTVGVKTTWDSEGRLQLASNELISGSRASREIFGVENYVDGGISSIPQGDDSSLFFQLLLHHELYRHRYDLVRKYVNVLSAM